MQRHFYCAPTEIQTYVHLPTDRRIQFILESILQGYSACFGIPHYCSVHTKAIVDVSSCLFSTSVDINSG